MQDERVSQIVDRGVKRWIGSVSYGRMKALENGKDEPLSRDIKLPPRAYLHEG